MLPKILKDVVLNNEAELSVIGNRGQIDPTIAYHLLPLYPSLLFKDHYETTFNENVKVDPLTMAVSSVFQNQLKETYMYFEEYFRNKWYDDTEKYPCHRYSDRFVYKFYQYITPNDFDPTPIKPDFISSIVSVNTISDLQYLLNQGYRLYIYTNLQQYRKAIFKYAVSHKELYKITHLSDDQLYQNICHPKSPKVKDEFEEKVLSKLNSIEDPAEEFLKVKEELKGTENGEK